ncbi:SDR family NAD(P)-dependent oxidoreductase [Roseivivax isoporae]|uniref:Oxidoreductase n=1 Tax=Roseivivax isoporae LMG 25204 TaxID=1449351 RepID=X7FAC6_9RHOB|nr:SDR family oxidoreductase [Roseivivax isoporae]ETX29877.1 oxidoreductase [Roseivivax isoporae LMG 25204]
MSFSIEGKTAIVTGAANGVGLAIARHFVEKGANVMFADIDEGRLMKEVGKQAEEARMRYFAGDLRERLTLANLLSATLDSFDRVDILVNGSRQMMPTDPLDMDDTSVETLMDQNLMTALRLSQQVAKRMIKQAEGQEGGQAGAIVNLSSIAARRTHPSLLGYSVSCAALDQMTRSLAVALAPHRIRVNAVSFGSVMSASLKQTLKDHREYRGDIEEHTPLGRIASPDELTEAVQFLCSDSARFVTGQIMTVDGGRTLLDPVAAPAH